jgi:hypothetical protein
MPKGFNRLGPVGFTRYSKGKSFRSIRLWPEGKSPEWDRFNVPVWAMEKEGYLFVRTYLPRLNESYIDVIERGTLDMVPGAINVGEFIDEID